MICFPLRRVTTAAICFAVVTTSTPAQAFSESKAPHYRAKGAAAARWQAGELVDGAIPGAYGGSDWGLTIDTAFMLAADGNRPVRLSRVTRAIRNHYLDDYASFEGTLSANAIAKSLLAAKVLNQRVRDFGSRNVRRMVLKRVARPAAGFESGRLRDRTTQQFATDYSNTLGQSLGVLGLARTGGVPQRAVGYLAKQQCRAGYLRLTEVAGETCQQSGSPADVDATAVAIQALVAARRSGAHIPNNALHRATNWLLDAQRRHGGFGGGAMTGDTNTNSTGLAAQALRATSHERARLRAADSVAGLQITRRRAGNGPARSDIGAIAYNRPALKVALAEGVTSATRDQFRRATPQAFAALVPKPLTTLSAP